MKFGWLGVVLIAVSLSLLLSCASNSTSSTNTMYVATQNAAQIWGYRANFNNGQLSTINGSPFSAQAGSSAIVIDPAKSFAYVSGFDSDQSVNAYDIQSFSCDTNGSLVTVGKTGPLTTNPSFPITAMAMDSGGKFLFVANQGLGINPGSISVFSIGSDASLTEVAGSPFPVPPNVPVPGAIPILTGLAVQSTLNMLYVTDQTDNYVLIYQYDPTTGALATYPQLNMPPVPTGSSPSAVAINPLGTFLYVANQASNNISGFTIDTTTPNNLGNLASISGSPFGAGTQPVSAAVDPSGQFLYVVDQGSNQISGYKIAPVDGKLAVVTGSPFSTGQGPAFVSISPTNKFLYVSNNTAGTISGFGIDPTSGTLSAVSATVTTGAQPVGIAFGK